MTCTRVTPPGSRLRWPRPSAACHPPSRPSPAILAVRPGRCRTALRSDRPGSPGCPARPVARISFSAPSALASAAATVSALMFSRTPLLVGRQRADDRYQAVFELGAQHVRIHRVDIADEPVVHRSAVMSGDTDRRTLVRANQAGVHAADTDRWQVDIPAGGQNACVDLPIEHHGRHFQCMFVGDPTALDELRRHAQRRGQFRRLRPAAVHQHDANADLVQDGDLLNQRLGGLETDEQFTAGLQHEDLALVHANVGRGVLERGHHDVAVLRVSASGCFLCRPAWCAARPSGRTCDSVLPG